MHFLFRFLNFFYQDKYLKFYFVITVKKLKTTYDDLKIGNMQVFFLVISLISFSTYFEFLILKMGFVLIVKNNDGLF